MRNFQNISATTFKSVLTKMLSFIGLRTAPKIRVNQTVTQKQKEWLILRKIVYSLNSTTV